MKLSVVILNYNVRYFLEQCIISVERSLKGIDAEIIVVDNDSKDDSCEMVKQRFPHLTLLQNTENVGFSKANNQAVAIAKGEYVCILNPDTAVAEHTFSSALQYAEGKDHLGALGICLMDGTGNFLPESKRNLPTPKRSLLKMIGRTNSKNGYYANYLGEKDKGRVEVLVGAFMLMRKDVYEGVKGFDEDYFMYGEDIDLSYKLTKAGYQNEYLGSLSMLHYKGESTQKDTAYLNRFYGAMRIFYRKHFRSNPLLNLAVNIGVQFAKITRKFKERKRSVKPVKCNEVLVFTENIGLLQKISGHFDIPVKSASKIILERATFHNTLCVFDVDYISYGQIFSVMGALKNKQNSFRIKPPGCNFIIGSDRSDEKGGVLQL
ncbi:glycosyltransferase family 2 protein [Aureisphaera galaxeae]|uniref:glycosyltransferase family 2 protein n=1 Tax=Aureisphaera galaxeae TaxID=1538023 RepID=UPI0023505142|nr:glycosyltransferase family 2 protein [Aureisphaera galaxeae]MDC8005449.1 glycosyltransferase family 2 protein [Aureisphaera galaxeae]